MENFTWTEQPLNDRELRPPTFTEIYYGEMFYSTILLSLVVSSLLAIKYIFKH